MRCELSVLVAALFVDLSLGQNGILTEKWGRVFDYRNLVKQTDGSGEVANAADFEEMEHRLENSEFRAVANDLAVLSYPPNIQYPNSTEYQTNEGWIRDMTSTWREHINDSCSSTGFNEIYTIITTITGDPLTREKFVAYELAVGVMNGLGAGDAFDKMMELVGKKDAQKVHTEDFSSAYGAYFEDDTVSADTLPLYGPAT